MMYTDAGPQSAGRSGAIDQPGARCLPEALAQLRRAGVLLVRFEYAGQCGCRREKPVTFHDALGRVVGRGISRGIHQDVTVFFHETLDLRFPEWAMAEGSRGEFEWNVDTDELTHRHQWRVVEYENVTVFGVSAAVA
ncbi:MAG: hypothetical protein WDO56_35235 [Gammaproteobacteria bacterium]